MTGTPVANTPEDLWSQIFFLDDGALLGESFEKFSERYSAPGGGYQRLKEVRARLGEISLRREKSGTVPLPAKTITRVPVPMASQASVEAFKGDQTVRLLIANPAAAREKD